MKYVAYPKTEPRAIDLIQEDDGKTALAIYAFTGDKLVVVMPELPTSTLPRPNNIADPGDGYMKFVFTRAK